MDVRAAVISLSALLLSPVAAKAQQQEPISPPERRDVLGRPIPWGKEVDGQFVSLWMPYTRLLYGQPIEVRLETANPTSQPPRLRLRLEGPRQTAFLQWTTGLGEPVTFAPPPGGGYSGMGGNLTTFRLQPTGKFASDPYLVPGAYRVRVIVETEWTPSDPIAWVGKIESNVVDFVVLDTDVQSRFLRVPEPMRARAIALVKELDDPNWEQRDHAEQNLIALGIDVLPFVESALEMPSPEVQLRARRIIDTLTEPLFKRHSCINRKAAAALLALLGDSAWKVVGDGMEPDRLEYWRVEAARYAPVRLLEVGDPLPPDVVHRLVEGLTSEAPDSRIVAMHNIPRTDNEEILTVLVDCLADPYSVYPQVMMRGDPSPEYLVGDEARRYGIPWRGSSVIAPLLSFARRQTNERLIRSGFEILERIDFDARVLAFARDLVATSTDDKRSYAVQLLGHLSPEAVPELLQVARDASEPGLRLAAIKAMSSHGDAATVGPFLVEMLKQDDPRLVRTAIRVVDRLRVREAIPGLKRLARDEKAEQNVRTWALGSYGRMADPEDAKELFIELLRSQNISVRASAVVGLGTVQCRECVPRILELLSDPEWVVRAQADRALRALAKKPEGVGFEPGNPDPATWATWWANRQ